ncbi:NAD-dependent epimerase/dehydratase family protein [Streptomyces sp. NPDC048172]|uniref:NAD-dependent epimerase/dehydratase family protein n=1 Tax=Streptomyces sp. NPDC048172 TaxID=3365505 RepID=UPI0037208B4E
MADGPRAFVLGATGQIGRAAVRALTADGWEVTAAARGAAQDGSWPDGVRAVALDRDEDGALAAAVGEDHALLVDTWTMTPAHTRQLTGLAGRVASAVVLSSGAVYEDGRGRSFMTQDEPDGFPRYPVPIPETQRTLPPGDRDYGSRKALMERDLLALGARLPVTLLRAGAVHGRHDRMPRELWFVKRWLDGRPVRILAYGGRSRFHTAHVDNLAELVRLAARRPGSRALNAADPEALPVARIAELMDTVLGGEAETVLLDGAPPEDAPTVGATPWSLPEPVVFDMTAAERELGYRPVTSYEESLPETVEWVAARVRGRDWREVYPQLAQVEGYGMFDYEAEDRWLAEHRR